MDKPKKPEWAPEGPDKSFATQVLPAAQTGHDGLPGAGARLEGTAGRRPSLSLEDYVKGVRERDRTVLGRAITLVESDAPAHRELAQEMLGRLLPDSGSAVRVGVSGVPGAGKSTFIEALGSLLCEKGHRVAVLAVDPSSTVSRGSILGDKTRMQKLARNPDAFIRPSPSSGVLGGVTRKTRETMLVCEAAGFDVILVETVGVGQSEVTVRSMVDFFLLVLIAGAGDELQGLKKGVMELCDAILVNKADGDNKQKALAARQELESVLHYLKPATRGWTTRALAASSRTGEGVVRVWETVSQFLDMARESGALAGRRSDQAKEWVHSLVAEYMLERFYSDPEVKAALPGIEKAVSRGELFPTQALARLTGIFEGRKAGKPCPEE